MFWNWATITTILAIVGWIIPFVMLFIIPVNRKPSSATAWLLLLFLLPYFGLVIFLLLGSPKLSKSRRAKQRLMDDLISKAVASARQQPDLAVLVDPPIPPRYEPFVKLNANLSDLPAFAGNAVELFPNYQGAFERIARDIDSAQRYSQLGGVRPVPGEPCRALVLRGSAQSRREDLPLQCANLAAFQAYQH